MTRNEITSNHETAFYLFYVECLDIQEIAKECKMKVCKVSKHLTQIRDFLRKNPKELDEFISKTNEKAQKGKLY